MLHTIEHSHKGTYTALVVEEVTPIAGSAQGEIHHPNPYIASAVRRLAKAVAAKGRILVARYDLIDEERLDAVLRLVRKRDA